MHGSQNISKNGENSSKNLKKLVLRKRKLPNKK